MTPRHSLADMERYLALAAYLVVRHGEQYSPTFQRLETEVAAMKSGQANVDRARSVLADLMRKEVNHVPAV